MGGGSAIILVDNSMVGGRGNLNPGCLFWRTPGGADQLSYKALGRTR